MSQRTMEQVANEMIQIANSPSTDGMVKLSPRILREWAQEIIEIKNRARSISYGYGFRSGEREQELTYREMFRG